MGDLKPNAALAYRVLDEIDANPAAWQQWNWTTCFAGKAIALAGGTIDPAPAPAARQRVIAGPVELIGMYPETAAKLILGLDTAWHRIDGDVSPTWLFASHITRDKLGCLIEGLFGPRPVSGVAS